ncbi:MAG: DUF3108 domain-containing protein [Candidatus Omnitrophica bacterium]|nr:DUF3108 domain-containing protein [Candidatus Omnitrophota bacterium]
MHRYTRPLLSLILVILAAVYFLGRHSLIQPLRMVPVFRWQAGLIPRPAAVSAVPVPERLGEKITYDVTMGVLRLGSAEFHYKERTTLGSKPADLVTFTTRLARFRDSETILSDPLTHLPLRVEREVVIWPRTERITEEYDQENFLLTVRKRSGSRESIVDFRKDAVIHNAILLPYAVRRVTGFEPGWTFTANLPTQKFTIRLQGVEEVRVPSGVFNAYHFVSIPERFEIWISADERRIPLKIRGTAGLGYILAMRGYAEGGGT